MRAADPSREMWDIFGLLHDSASQGSIWQQSERIPLSGSNVSQPHKSTLDQLDFHFVDGDADDSTTTFRLLDISSTQASIL